MRKVLVSFALMVVASFCLAGPPYNNTVSTTSVKVLPKRTLQNAATWTNGVAVAQGAYVKNGSKFYMAVEAGTTGSTIPVHSAGDVSDGGVIWRRVARGERSGFAVVNDSTNAIYISVSYDAEGGKGIRLNAEGGAFWIDDDSFQDEVFVISESGTNNVTSLEW